MFALYPLLATAVVANPLLLSRQKNGGKASFVEPEPRGGSAGAANQSPCGGVAFDDTKDHHQYWGMLADFYMQVENDVSDIQLSWSRKTDMAKSQVFQKLQKATAGSIGLDNPVKFSELGLKRGDEITVQLQYHDDVTDQWMFNCVDLHLTSDHAYDPPQHLECRNTSFIRVDENTGTNTEVVPGGKKQKVSPVGAGFIGAGATIAVVLLALLGLKLGGCLFFSRGSFTRAERRRTSNPFEDNISLNDSMHKAPMGVRS